MKKDDDMEESDLCRCKLELRPSSELPSERFSNIMAARSQRCCVGTTGLSQRSTSMLFIWKVDILTANTLLATRLEDTGRHKHNKAGRE